MFTAHLNRSDAKRGTIVMGAVALGAIAVGALAMGGGEGRLPEPPEPVDQPAPEVDDQANQDAPTRLPPDLYAADVASALSIGYQWEPEEPEGGAAVEGDTPPPVPNVPDVAAVRYLGSIVGPERRMAILSISGDQRVIAEGASASGSIELVEVADGHVVIRRDGSLEKIEKAAPSAQTYTLLAGGSPPPEGEGLGSGAAQPTSGDEALELRRMRAREKYQIKQNAGRPSAVLDAAGGAAGAAEGTVITPGGARMLEDTVVRVPGGATSTAAGSFTDDRDER